MRSLAIVVGAALTGCIPIRTTFLKPLAPGAEHAGTICGGVTGEPSRMVLRGPGEVIVAVDAYRLERSGGGKDQTGRGETGVGLTLILHVPASEEVRFASAEFVLVDRRSSGTLVGTAEAAFDLDHPILVDGRTAWNIATSRSHPRARFTSVTEPLRGTGRRHWNVRPRWFKRQIDHPYYVVVVFEGAGEGPFGLRIPPVRMDSLEHVFPEVEIRRVSEWWIVPMNC
jgi:hypothetical protein